MALDAFKRRCQERIARSKATYTEEIEEKIKAEEEKLQAVKQLEQRELLKKQCLQEAEHVENTYKVQALDDTSNPTTTSNPLILDEIVTPISEPTCRVLSSGGGRREASPPNIQASPLLVYSLYACSNL